MRLLVEHDWHNEPLVVDINDDLIGEIRRMLKMKHVDSRDALHDDGFQESRQDPYEYIKNLYKYMRRDYVWDVQADKSGVHREAIVIVTPRCILERFRVLSQNIGRSSRWPYECDGHDLTTLIKIARASLKHLERLLQPTWYSFRHILNYDQNGVGAKSETDALSPQVFEPKHLKKGKSYPQSWLQIFRMNLNRFDFLIYLDRNNIPDSEYSVPTFDGEHTITPIQNRKSLTCLRQSTKKLTRGYETRDDFSRKQLLVGFNPAILLMEKLETRYGSRHHGATKTRTGIRFYYDRNGGDVIGATFKVRLILLPASRHEE